MVQTNRCSTAPSLVLRAAVADRPAGVELLIGHGFDVDARGRQDLPVEEPWETALHHAAGREAGPGPDATGALLEPVSPDA